MHDHPSIAPLTAVIVLLAAALGGCADGADCGEGMTLEQDVCIANASAGDGDGDGDATGDAAVGDAAPQRPGADDGFGDPCTDDVDHSECGGAADYCAVMPGSGGVCTATGCADDETVCPVDYGCLDLSTIDPELPSICTAP